MTKGLLKITYFSNSMNVRSVFCVLALVVIVSACNQRTTNEEKTSIETVVKAEAEVKIDTSTKTTGVDEEAKKMVASLINKKYFINETNGLKTVLFFDSDYNGFFGQMTVAQNQCRTVYTYDIESNVITAEFYGSECKGDFEKKYTLQCDNNGYLTMTLNGQEFIFEPMFEGQ